MLKQTKFIILLIVFFVIANISALATESNGTPEALSEYEKGQELLKKRDHDGAAEFFRKAIELDHNFGKAHDDFTFFYRQLANPKDSEEYRANREKKTVKLIEIYNEWIKKYPKSAGFYYGLGNIYKETKPKLATESLNKALKLDPKFARAWYAFSLMADVSGNLKKQDEYFQKAVDAAPDEPSYLFYYAKSLDERNPALYEKLALQLVDRFPKHNRAAQSLYWLGSDNRKNPEKSIAFLERLVKQFPVNDYSWSSSGASLLFEMYQKHNPAKALTFAQELATTFKDENSKKSWQAAVDYKKNINQATDLIKDKKFAEALAVLEKTTVPRMILPAELAMLKNEVHEAAGDFQKAYDNATKQLATNPSDKFQATVNRLGAKLNKTPDQIKADVWKLLDAGMKPAKELKLVHYKTGKEVTLNDYKGKVVMINFWYPYCGPCRGENPTLQKVLKKIGRDKFEILAVNVHPEEDEYVMPYLTGMKFDFVPLRGTSEFAEKVWGAYGYPTNYLIDPSGRMSPRVGNVVGDDAERSFELKIRMLLERGASK